MAYQKTQGREAHNVIASDDANIPYTRLRIEGTSGIVGVNKLVISSGSLITQGVQIGDIVYNNDTNTAATVTDVTSATDCTLNANIFTAAGASYSIYAASPGEGEDANNGCVLYIGKSGDLSVNVVGGVSPVIFKAVPIGFFPMQVIKINKTATDADSFVAIW